MDVALLSTMISELITDHNQVGLPGLGTFVAEVVPATFSDKGYTINPPYRRLSFHPSRSEDTLLIDFYAASNGISKEAAGLYLKQFLSEMKTVLKERKTIVLPGLGRLRATVENNFFFVSDPDLDIYPDGFALKPLSLKTISEPEAVEIPLGPVSLEVEPDPVAAQGLPAEAATVASQAPVTSEETVLVSEAVLSQPSATVVEEKAAETAESGEGGLTDPSQPEELPAPVRTMQESCAPEGVVRTDRSEEDAPCAPDAILRTEVPVVRTEAGTEAGAEVETRTGTGEEVELESDSEQTPVAERCGTSAAESEDRKEIIGGTSGRHFRWWIPLLVLLAVAAVALLAFLTVAQVAPDLIDSILYTPEELKIINY